MSGLLRSEVLKVRSTRLWWIIALCVFVLAAGWSVFPALIPVLTKQVDPSVAFRDPATLKSVYNGGNSISRILALVVGILSMGAEYRHRTLATTYLATPSRLKVIGAKVVALLGYGLLYGAISVLAGVLAAVPYIAYYSGSLRLDDGGVWRSLILGAVSVALWVLIGMGIGILIPNMIVAMLVGVVFAYILEPVASLVFRIKDWNTALNLMPTGATQAMLGISSPGTVPAAGHPFAWWLGALVLVGWALLPGVLGVALTLRRDVV